MYLVTKWFAIFTCIFFLLLCPTPRPNQKRQRPEIWYTHSYRSYKINSKKLKKYLRLARSEQRYITVMDAYCDDRLIKIHMTEAKCVFFYLLIYVCGFVVVFVVLPMTKQNLVHALPCTISKTFFFLYFF